jgi:hypothetical protein
MRFSSEEKVTEENAPTSELSSSEALRASEDEEVERSQPSNM